MTKENVILECKSCTYVSITGDLISHFLFGIEVHNMITMSFKLNLYLQRKSTNNNDDDDDGENNVMSLKMKIKNW